MGTLFENLKNYFENTPKDILDNDWKDIEYLNEIGPDVIEYARCEGHYTFDMSYLDNNPNLQSGKFNFAGSFGNHDIQINTKYYCAA